MGRESDDDHVTLNDVLEGRREHSSLCVCVCVCVCVKEREIEREIGYCVRGPAMHGNTHLSESFDSGLMSRRVPRLRLSQ